MRLNYASFIFCLILTLTALIREPSLAEQNMPFVGEVNSNSINLRTDSTPSAPVICTLNKGDKLEVELEFYDWYKVRLPMRASVYIKETLTECINFTAVEPGSNVKPACVSAKVLKERVNIRVKPKESAAILGVADKNEIINVTGEEGGWYKIEPIQNSFGWINKKFVTKLNPAEKISLTKNSLQVTLPNTDNNILLTGKVEPYGVVWMRPATHKLVTQDKGIFFLKGNKKSLNGLNYQNVKVIGKIISPQKTKYPVVEVKIIEVVN